MFNNQARTTDSESASGLTHLEKAGSFPGPLVFYRVCKQDPFFREMKWQLDAAGQVNPVTAQMRVPGSLCPRLGTMMLEPLRN